MENFCMAPFCKCNLSYAMSMFFIVVGNIFIYFLILDNAFNIYWGTNDITIRFLFWLFAEFIILFLARCLCNVDINKDADDDATRVLI